MQLAKVKYGVFRTCGCSLVATISTYWLIGQRHDSSNWRLASTYNSDKQFACHLGQWSLECLILVVKRERLGLQILTHATCNSLSCPFWSHQSQYTCSDQCIMCHFLLPINISTQKVPSLRIAWDGNGYTKRVYCLFFPLSPTYLSLALPESLQKLRLEWLGFFFQTCVPYGAISYLKCLVIPTECRFLCHCNIV